MRKLLYTVLLLSVMLACTHETDENSAGGTDSESLQKELAMLKSENLKKDSLITESITYFNEIERNLSAIELKEKEIRAQFSDLGTAPKNDKQIILQKIKYINDLRLENGRKMYALQRKLDTIDIAENEFAEIMKRLQTDIRHRDKEITSLQKTLEQKDQQYARLFADYQSQVALNHEQAQRNSEISTNLNTVYYAYGSQKELKSNNIIAVSRKGLASKKIRLNEHFNESYFTSAKLSEMSEIDVEAKEITLITDHPESSYQLIREGSKTRLRILNPELFWKVSRYLVVMTD